MTEELTVRQIAALTGMRLCSIYNDLWSGHLRGRQENGRWFISKDEAERYRQTRRGAKQTQPVEADHAETVA